MDNLSNLPFNLFDVSVILILVISGVFAYSRGFIHETLSVIGWVGAIIITIKAFPFIKPITRQYIQISELADFISGAIIFLTALVILWYFTQKIAGKVRASLIRPLDKSLGFLFGIVRGAVLVCILYIGAELILPVENKPKWIVKSRSIPLVNYGATQLKLLIPSDNLVPSINYDPPPIKSPKTLIEELLTPQKRNQETDKLDGYQKLERQQIDRLIQGNSDN